MTIKIEAVATLGANKQTHRQRVVRLASDMRIGKMKPSEFCAMMEQYAAQDLPLDEFYDAAELVGNKWRILAAVIGRLHIN